MPPITKAQRAQGPWVDPGRWVCLEDGCPRHWRHGGGAAWRHHNTRYHPGPHPAQRGVATVAVIESGRLDDSQRAISHDYVRRLLARQAH